MMIPLKDIAPLACLSPADVRRYVAYLNEGKNAPPIVLIKQRRGSRFRYRIFDGAHRVRAARRAGRTKIAACIIVFE
jgi:uncharacterized ParB-like nuclease family protein